MAQKRFYWIKLKTDFFNQETIDFLLTQKNGCEYVVLYQMLCLNTANTNGMLVNQIGEVIVPYNVEKIVRDTKYFDFDTVTVALELFKKLGLIYEEENKILKIADIERMIGSESATRDAIKKREQRLKKKIEDGTQIGTNCLIEYRDKSIEYRDKSIEYRDKSIDINNKNNINNNKKFVKPTLEEVKQYCEERNNNVDPEVFIDFYESKGWKVGKNSMKDWKACVRNWERNRTKSNYKNSRDRINEVYERFLEEE